MPPTIHFFYPSALDPSFSCKSGIPSRDDVLLIAHELGTKWKMLGRVLKVPDPVVEQIKKGNDELSERCYSEYMHLEEDAKQNSPKFKMHLRSDRTHCFSQIANCSCRSCCPLVSFPNGSVTSNY